MRLLAIDPGIHNTGYAVFDSKDKLCEHGTIRVPEKMVMLERVDYLLHTLFCRCKAIEVVVELPEPQRGVRGTMAMLRGDMLKTSILVGAIFGARWGCYNTWRTCHMVTPSQWKGQLPKTVTQAQCKKLYGVEKKHEYDADMIDAIMLGHWWLTEGCK